MAVLEICTMIIPLVTDTMIMVQNSERLRQHLYFTIQHLFQHHAERCRVNPIQQTMKGTIYFKLTKGTSKLMENQTDQKRWSKESILHYNIKE